MMNNTADWRELVRGGFVAQFALLLLGVWLNAADSLITVTIMPSVARQIGGYAYFGWATAAFLLGAITAGASAGAAALRLGLRRAMVLAGAVYAFGCCLDAASPSILAFLAGRLVQGVGAGWLVGLVYVAVGAVFPERLWARVFAAITGVWGVAVLVGPFVGGVFAMAGAWRGAFWLFAAQGGLFCLAAARLLPAEPPAAERRPLPWRQLGLIGGGVLAIGAAGLVKGLPAALGLTALGLCLLVFMLKADAAAASGLLPRSARDLRSPAGAGYLTIFLLQAGTVSWSVYGSAFVQAIDGATPLEAGYVVGAEAVGWTLAALPIAGLKDRWHPLFIRLGAACVLFGMAGIALFLGRGGVWAAAAFSTAIGCGFGLAWAFLNRRILETLKDEERSLGSSAIPTVQMIGSAAGAAGTSALGDLLGLDAGVGRTGALAAAPILFAAFLPLLALGWAAAHRASGSPRRGREESAP